MDMSNMSVLINRGASEALRLDKNLRDNGAHRWIYVSFGPYTCEVTVAPEFPSLITGLLITSLLAAVAARWKMKVNLAAS